LLAHRRQMGSWESAVETALKLLTLDPLHEPVHRVLMQLYVDLGRRGAALRQYHRCARTLQHELGTEPETETKALYGEILRTRSSRVLQGETLSRHRADPQQTHRRPQPLEGRSTDSTGGASTVELQLVGRDAELAVLGRALDDAIGGRGKVIAIV